MVGKPHVVFYQNPEELLDGLIQIREHELDVETYVCHWIDNLLFDHKLGLPDAEKIDEEEWKIICEAEKLILERIKSGGLLDSDMRLSMLDVSGKTDDPDPAETDKFLADIGTTRTEIEESFRRQFDPWKEKVAARMPMVAQGMAFEANLN